jgi:hypothetical protein
MPTLKVSTLVGAFLLTLVSPAWANDFMAGGTPSDLVPVDETRIGMQSEDIVMEYNDGEWLVSADYVFWNSSEELVAQKVGFPELNCDPNAGYDCNPDAFKNLVTKVDGKAVAHSRGKISGDHVRAKPSRCSRGWRWVFGCDEHEDAVARVSYGHRAS